MPTTSTHASRPSIWRSTSGVRSAATCFIDLIGYRRFGHNEQDEPAYTQPQMSERIKNHPTVRELFANKLVNQGVLSAERAREMVELATARLKQARHAAKGALASHIAGRKMSGSNTFDGTVLAPVAREQLVAWCDALTAVPEGFALNRKLRSQFERRAATIAEKGIVDWGTAESLAFASLLSAGTPIRLTGQDTERGTFSHRHAVFHPSAPSRPAAPGREIVWIPLQHLAAGQASFEIRNSPLSEYACMGFEYGYSTQQPDALVLVGSPVWRLLQRRRDRRRSIHRRRAGEVGSNVTADAAAAARIRRRRSRTF